MNTTAVFRVPHYLMVSNDSPNLSLWNNFTWVAVEWQSTWWVIFGTVHVDREVELGVPGSEFVCLFVWVEGAWYELLQLMGFLFLSPSYLPFSSWRCHLDSSMGQKWSGRLGNYHHRFTRWFGQSLEMVWISSSFSALMVFFHSFVCCFFTSFLFEFFSILLFSLSTVLSPFYALPSSLLLTVLIWFVCYFSAGRQYSCCSSYTWKRP